jgi:hypothetical protein
VGAPDLRSTSQYDHADDDHNHDDDGAQPDRDIPWRDAVDNSDVTVRSHGDDGGRSGRSGAASTDDRHGHAGAGDALAGAQQVGDADDVADDVCGARRRVADRSGAIAVSGLMRRPRYTGVP